jgi:hypothetical protein
MDLKLYNQNETFPGLLHIEGMNCSLCKFYIMCSGYKRYSVKCSVRQSVSLTLTPYMAQDTTRTLVCPYNQFLCVCIIVLLFFTLSAIYKLYSPVCLVCLSVCLSVCLPACLPACLSIFLSVLFYQLHPYLLICLYIYVHISLSIYLLIYIL